MTTKQLSLLKAWETTKNSYLLNNVLVGNEEVSIYEESEGDT